MISPQHLNIIFEAMRTAEINVMKHTGLQVKCKIDLIDTKGDPNEMMNVIAEAMGQKVELLYVRTRKRAVVETRMLAVYFIRKHYEQYTLNDIGKLFGEHKYDHSSIKYYLTMVEELLEGKDKPFAIKYKKCVSAVQTWIRQS